MPKQFTEDPKVEPLKVIIGGTRTFDDYKLLQDRVEFYTYWESNILVVSGAQKKRIGYNQFIGADYLGEKWALSNWYTLVRFHADWDKHGRKAGPIRNREMAKFADAAILFWDGSSPGTADMIEVAKFYGLKLRVVRY